MRLFIVAITLIMLASCGSSEPKYASYGMEETIPHGKMLTADSTRTFQRDDIVVYLNPNSDVNKQVSRIKGLPGDSVSLEEYVVFVNGQKEKELATLVFPYSVRLTAQAKRDLFKKHKVYSFYPYSQREYHVLATKASADGLRRAKEVLSMKMSLPEYSYTSVFPKNNPEEWSEFNYGPIYVPAKGDSIHVTVDNLEWYSAILTRFEKVKTDSIEKVLKQSGKFDFKLTRNYYFIIGDNRSDARDSRNFGFLPDSNIVGLAK